MGLKFYTLADQQEDGSFLHYVIFSEVAPWDAEDQERMLLSSEYEAQSLESTLNGMLSRMAAAVECSVYEQTILPEIYQAWITRGI